MIQANEIRVGNYLNYQTAEGDIMLTVIDWQDIKWISEDPKGFNLVHDPIPITEDWLLKLGFENSDPVLIQNNYGDLIYLSDFLNTIYIHQLQNFYFALTGEELNLKPTEHE